MKSDRAGKILQAAIEAGVIEHGELTIVIVANENAELDIASVAPSPAAADLVPATLILALGQLHNQVAELKSRTEVGKA